MIGRDSLPYSSSGDIDETLKSVTFPSGVSMKQESLVIFNSRGMGVDSSGDATVAIVVTKYDSSIYGALKIYPTGYIEMFKTEGY